MTKQEYDEMVEEINLWTIDMTNCLGQTAKGIYSKRLFQILDEYIKIENEVEEAIKFGNMWLETFGDAKDSNTYNFFKISIKALEQEPNIRHCFGCKYSKDNHNQDIEECHLCMWENQYTPQEPRRNK